ncbi:hypothetical protein [Prochlorococcus marinus]|uniref:Uncharacterized protein n=1 Tax=Prochlorococcus marinus XMU1408 TaxID=2213228 RepID=A0A318RCE0_PROMR|nr:hypothetical protein [Prochlorococcus marinus]MBW3042351.1 hypothetical protein [Prochlorococcus marinus str. XMU1408]PYE01092.1 hypothetical protein DNJ73_06565 [Prochlorococcus marinus XMU1408]
MYAKQEIRSLIDNHLSLQWCRENVVIPLRIENKNPPEESILIIAVGNISYLGTIGKFIQERVKTTGLNCYFTEMLPEKIEEILESLEVKEVENE